VSVVDDGSGIEQTSQKQGFGLLSMEERVRDLHGILSLKRIEPAGTELSAEIPILGVA
jgi:signal transduction histidine kinase